MTLALNVGPTAFVGPNPACASHSCSTKKSKQTIGDSRTQKLLSRAIRMYSPVRLTGVSLTLRQPFHPLRQVLTPEHCRVYAIRVRSKRVAAAV
jgi:hypothetical protein